MKIELVNAKEEISKLREQVKEISTLREQVAFLMEAQKSRVN